MAYQDKASPAEVQLLALFNARLPAILAYKRSHGGDLEGAFQAVTGTPWPADRSVKLSGGKGEITADRTVKSVMGRYVAPIAAAAAGGVGLSALAAPAAAGGMTAATAAGAPGALGASILANGAAGGASLWGKLAPSLIGLGATAVGGYMQNRAAGKAADQQVASADKALALQQRMFDTTQANQQPYMQAGSGAVTRLNSLMGGSPMPQPQNSLATLQPQAPQQQPQLVNMKAPDGSMKQVPFNEVAHYTQLGAQRVF